MAIQRPLKDEEETGLWYWFLFDSGLSTLRAKRCLDRWLGQGLSLKEVLDRLPDQHQHLGLTRDEARKLRPPASRPAIPALRWNSPHYPDGLRDLALKRRPALLFVRGHIDLLARPIVALVSGNPDEDEMTMLREVTSVLLGENLLLAALADSVQATLLLEEMTYSDGEALIMATSGLDQYETTAREARYLAEERLVLMTPLPPSMADPVTSANSIGRINPTHPLNGLRRLWCRGTAATNPRADPRASRCT